MVSSVCLVCLNCLFVQSWPQILDLTELIHVLSCPIVYTNQLSIGKRKVLGPGEGVQMSGEGCQIGGNQGEHFCCIPGNKL